MNPDNSHSGITRAQALEEVARLKKIYADVRLIDADGLKKAKCLFFEEGVCMRQVCAKVLDDGRERTSVLRIGDEANRATARYVDVEGIPNVLVYVEQINPAEDGPIDKEIIYHDALSGAFNRRFFEDELRHQRLYAGVALIDLDDFKIVNDTLGHHAGDMAIKAVVGSILRCVRDSDMLVRYGGDEFVLVMPNISQDVFVKRLHAVSEAVRKTTVPGYDQVSLSISVGGVMLNGGLVEEAVQNADRLMYRAKQRHNMVMTDFEGEPSDDEGSQRPLLLIVDDSSMNRDILAEMLRDEYEIVQAKNGKEAISALEEYDKSISLMLLDIIMPEMDGFEVLSVMNRRGWIEDIPVIMISSEDSNDSVLRAYELGASDYIGRPFDGRVVRQRVSNVMRLYIRQRRLSSLLAEQYNERAKSSNVLVNIMGGAMELRNGESGPHVLHVRNLTEILLDKLMRKTDRYEISGVDRATIVMTSTLHDIGKLAIPDNILNKPGRLTADEFEIMKTHTTLGAEMLERLNMYTDNQLLLQTAHDICRWHHERWDGNGYPDGLKGDEIPISAQVVSLADVYDALTSERVYKSAVSHETAMKMIMNGESGVFNPLLLECLEEVSERVKQELDSSAIDPPPSSMYMSNRRMSNENA